MSRRLLFVGLVLLVLALCVSAQNKPPPAGAPAPAGDDGKNPRQYGRGAGFCWRANDKQYAWNKCMEKFPGGCEWYGSCAYPKCKAGYKREGCCICKRM